MLCEVGKKRPGGYFKCDLHFTVLVTCELACAMPHSTLFVSNAMAMAKGVVHYFTT